MDQSAAASRKKEIAAALGVLAIIIILVLAITLTYKKQVDTGLASSSRTASSNSGQTSKTVSASSYKDGSYSAMGVYDSPGGQESITVKVTLESGTVTGTSAKSGAVDDEAQQYQSQFISGYKKLIVGKPINSIELSRVSGSSLTSEGFNEAIDQIKQQAQS